MSIRCKLFFIFLYSFLICDAAHAADPDHTPKNPPLLPKHHHIPHEEPVDDLIPGIQNLLSSPTAGSKSAPSSTKKQTEILTLNLPEIPQDFSDSLYKKAQKVSKKFLKNTPIVQKKVEPFIAQFQTDYAEKKPTTLDITALSSRARIHLITQVIRHKQTTLPFSLENYPTYREGFNKNYETLMAQPTPYWQAAMCSKNDITYREVIDQLPLWFKIAGQSYRFETRMTPSQPGSGKLYGICRFHVAETYTKLKQFILTAYSNQDQQKIEGFKLLLDYEVARRLITGDAFEDLPIIVSHIFFLEHIDQDSFDAYTGKVLGGKERVHAIKEMMKKNFTPETTRKDIRKVLEKFHDDEENSQEDYATTEEEELGDTSI